MIKQELTNLGVQLTFSQLFLLVYLVLSWGESTPLTSDSSW